MGINAVAIAHELSSPVLPVVGPVVCIWPAEPNEYDILMQLTERSGGGNLPPVTKKKSHSVKIVFPESVNRHASQE